MELTGNALNGRYLGSIIKEVDRKELVEIKLAVAYVTQMDEVFALADRRGIPLTLYALADGDFPATKIIKRFIESKRPQWQLFLTAKHYHPKIYWFRGVGAYIGSGNLTDGGLMGNLECGVWFDEADLAALDWGQSLADMFAVIAKRSTAASAEHLAAFERLASRRAALEQQKRALAEEARKALAGIAGQDPPLDPLAGRGGGAARQAFVQQWHAGLTILRKMTAMMGELQLPAWVLPETPRSIVQDQATEGWYRADIRYGNDDDGADSFGRIEEYHRRNLTNPEAATRAALQTWATTADPDRFERWVNEHPAELRRLLARDRLQTMTEAELGRVLYLTHSAREHGRQIRKTDLGLDPESSSNEEDRIRIWAGQLINSRSRAGKSFKDVVQYVLWGDATEPDCAQRIWRASFDPDWKLRHLGVNILGELVGYARPGDFPPRNGRVSKTLHALGYQGISW